jgi:hypothetical protein
MKPLKTFNRIIMFVLTTMLVFGCGKKGGNDDKDSTSATTNTTPASGQEGNTTKEIALKKLSNDTIGFTIMIPEGAKEEESPIPNMMRLYSFNLSDMLGITVKVGKMMGEFRNLDDAVQNAKVMSPAAVKDKKAVGSNYLVVKEPQGVMQEFFYYVKTSGPTIFMFSAPVLPLRLKPA